MDTRVVSPTISKAFIYLMRNGRELLVLAHPEHPEAGLQVPAGTVEVDETPEAAACRELTEETGLRDFRICSFLGERTFDMKLFGKEEIHRRFFYHAAFTGSAPERWRHMEDHSGSDPIPIELYWCNLEEGLPNLIAGHGDLLHLLPGSS